MGELKFRFKAEIRKQAFYFTPSIYCYWGRNGLKKIVSLAFDFNFLIFGFGFIFEKRIKSDIKF